MKKTIIQIATVCGLVLLAYGGYHYMTYNKPIQDIVAKSNTSYDQASKVYSTVKLSGKDQNTPNKDFQQIASKAITDKPVLYILYKTGCENCQKMFPIEQEFIKKLPAETQSHIYYVNAQSDLGYELKGKYNLKTNTAVILELNDGENARVYSLKYKSEQSRDSLADVFDSLRSRVN